MFIEIKEETLETLDDYYADPGWGLDWPSVFNLPLWLRSWWGAFGGKKRLYLHSVWRDGQLLGIAPLVLEGKSVRLVGSPDVCDYLDFITVPGYEEKFFEVLLPALKERGLGRIELSGQRPDAAVFRGIFTSFTGGENLNAGVSGTITPDNETFELALSSTWEEYLAGLKKKQRHEVRRKLRRLENETDDYRYRVIAENGAVQDFIPQFFELFQQNPEKAGFLTEKRARFFRSLIDAAAGAGLACFGLLEIDGAAAAAVLYFDYRGRIYLYNSGYKPEYAELSAGLLSKVLCVRENIEKGRAVFDFLKGREVYKSRLGGTAIPVYSVQIEVS